MPHFALGHSVALSLLTIAMMLGGALATKPRATKGGDTTMIRGLGMRCRTSAG